MRDSVSLGSSYHDNHSFIFYSILLVSICFLSFFVCVFKSFLKINLVLNYRTLQVLFMLYSQGWQANEAGLRGGSFRLI